MSKLKRKPRRKKRPDFIKDYVIYNENDDVIAVGTRPECRDRLGWTERTIQNYLAVPPVGYTVVVFNKGKYECTRHGKSDNKAEVLHA